MPNVTRLLTSDEVGWVDEMVADIVRTRRNRQYKVGGHEVEIGFIGAEVEVSVHQAVLLHLVTKYTDVVCDDVVELILGRAAEIIDELNAPHIAEVDKAVKFDRLYPDTHWYDYLPTHLGMRRSRIT